MKRRGFIKTGLVTMAGGASSPFAVGEIIAPVGENISQFEMENFMSEMDTGMDLISRSGGYHLNNLVPQVPTEDEQNYFRASLRSLLLIGNFSDLPIKGQVHPWMQKRLIYSSPEVNYTVSTSLDILRNMSDETREEVRSALIEDPELGDRILESLDLDARSIGVHSARRRQMRVMGKRIIRRLRHSPEMFIDEYVSKAEKLIAANNPDETSEFLFRSRMGENEYSARRDEAEKAALHWGELGIPDSPIAYNPVVSCQEVSTPPGEEMDLKKRKGWNLLGIGIIVTVVGWLFIAIAGGSELVFWIGVVSGVTIGPILILSAIIVLIVQAVKSKKSGK